MPEVVDRRTWTLRDATEGDGPFLRTLYADTHGADFAAADLSAASEEMLVEQQFVIRERAYAGYPGIRSSIVLVDGRPAGRLLVAEDVHGLLLVDIAMLGMHRGRGIGTALLSELAAEADGRGIAISLHVGLHSPARHLYGRLGFVPTRHDAFRVLMRREPAQHSEKRDRHD